MRHFDRLREADRVRLFARTPREFTADADAATLGACLGATLYMPATRRHLAEDLLAQRARGVLSAVVCLEDAIADPDLPAATDNVVTALRALGEREAPDGPLVFVRVRHPDQIPTIAGALRGRLRALSGFVLPKFSDSCGPSFLDAVADTAHTLGHRLLAMPVLESPAVIHAETRVDELVAVARLLAKHRRIVPAVRIGGADLCATYGLRRSRDLTIYDVHLVARVISDVVNVLGRTDGSGFAVSGPVWEYFPRDQRLFKPQLRSSPFDEHAAGGLRDELITRDLDGLIREVVLDRANGLTGKTVIHPSHVRAVHALQVVSSEEYADAEDVLGTDGRGGGVSASRYGDKMNEGRPHRAWARRIMARAAAFGVAAEDVNFVDLLAASP